MWLVLALGWVACDNTEVTRSPGDGLTGADSATAADAPRGDNDMGDPYIQADSCAELSSTACFANHECNANQRCQDVGQNLGEVVCCVTGARGTALAGTSCAGVDGQLFCASGICINSGAVELCSQVCTTVADCPTGMKRCMTIAFADSTDNWCFPE